MLIELPGTIRIADHISDADRSVGNHKPGLYSTNVLFMRLCAYENNNTNVLQYKCTIKNDSHFQPIRMYCPLDTLAAGPNRYARRRTLVFMT